jgi:hypothetical protein
MLFYLKLFKKIKFFASKIFKPFEKKLFFKYFNKNIIKKPN